MLKIKAAALSLVSLISFPLWANGGITAGGGGSLPTNPADERVINDILDTSRKYLFLYFGKLSQTKAPKDEIYKKLFSEEKDIFSVLKAFKIFRQERGPCLDQAGRPWDGSAPGPEEKTICISVENLARKLTLDNAYVQTLALVAHEYSHLVGLDEQQAQKLQTSIVTNLRGTSSKEGEEILKNHALQYASIALLADNIHRDLDLPEKRLCEMSFFAVDGLAKATTPENTSYFSLFQERNLNLFSIGSLRATQLWLGICAVAEGSHSKRESYEGLFFSRPSITFNEWVAKISKGAKEQGLELPSYVQPLAHDVTYRNFIVGRNLNHKVLIQELYDLKAWAQDQIKLITELQNLN